MKNYKLTDPHPFTYPQLVVYCSHFYKKRFVEKLIAQAIEKDASLKEDALMCDKPKTFYRDEILTVMGEIEPTFKVAEEQHKGEAERQKEQSSQQPARKLMSAILGDQS